MNIIRSLKVLDIFASGFGLNMSGHPAYKTYTGLIFTIIYLVSIIYLSVEQFRGYFDSTNPVSTSEVFSNPVYARVDLVKQKLIPFFVGLSTDTDWIPSIDMNRYLTLRVHRLTWVTRVVNGQTITDKLSQFYSVVACSELDEREMQMYDYIDKGSPLYLIFMRYGMCPKVGKSLIIEGQGSDPVSDSFFFNIKACSLYKKEDCVSSSNVNRVNFKFIYPSLNFNSSDYENPHKRVANADIIFYVAPKQKQIYTLKLRESGSLDNRGLLADWVAKESFYDLSDPTMTFTNRAETLTYCPPEGAYGPEGSGCGSYFTFSIQSSGNVVQRRRSYRTLAQTFSSIGGLNGILMIAFTFIYSYINDAKRATYILNTVYSQMVAKGHERIQREENEAINAGKTKLEQTKTRLFRCFCRQKSKAMVDFERQKELALQRIEESLDVVNIVRDSYLVRVMSHILLKERHLGLAQLVDVYLWNIERVQMKHNKKAEEEFLSQDQSVGLFNRAKAKKSLRISTGNSLRKSWQKEILKKCKETEGLYNPEENEMETLVDRFYKEHLNKVEFDNLTEAELQTRTNIKRSSYKDILKQSVKPTLSEQGENPSDEFKQSKILSFQYNHKNMHRTNRMKSLGSSINPASIPDENFGPIPETNDRLNYNIENDTPEYIIPKVTIRPSPFNTDPTNN